MDKTLTQLITETQKHLYQQAGISVQIYSQDNLALKLQNAFDFVFGGAGQDIWWKRFGVFETYTLDGTTGRVTGTVSDTFRSFDDIYRIFPEDSDVPLNKLSIERNPNRYTGTYPRTYMFDTTNTFRVAPFTATGDVVVVGREAPSADFALTDVVPFDHLALTHYAAWSYCVDDAANPAMADKFLKIFETRIKDLKRNQANEPISLTENHPHIPDRWGEP